MKPAHHETGAVRKEWGGKLPVLLVYPDTYRAGMSNLAVHTLYRTMNAMDDVVCERCFWHKGQKGRPVSMESSRQAGDFSVIAFSISFETDFINTVDFIAASGMELYASKRTGGPLLIAGGIAVTLNPEPVADFMDACIIGEAEGLLQEVLRVVREGLDRRSGRDHVLDLMDRLEGVYVPSLYRVKYNADNTIREIRHRYKKGKKVRRHRGLLSGSVSSTAVYTDDTTFSGMHLQEVSRGCGYRCRFCISGYAYLPPRHRDILDLKKDLDAMPSGVKKVGIVSPMVTDYPDLPELLGYIHKPGLKASLSSMRADSLALLDMSRVEMSTDQFSAAIAPEAGTYRLRRILNKDLRDEQILQAAQVLGGQRVHTLKLYFLAGIPGETDDDAAAIADLALQVKKRLKGGRGRVTLSINPLIPKPFTPFQWIGTIRPDLFKQRLNIIKHRLKGADIGIEWEKHYLLQAILSRGDRRLDGFLAYLSKTDQSLGRAIFNSGVDLDYYVFRERGRNEILPWDFMDYGFKKSFLTKEYGLGLSGVITPVCRPETCTLCGICGAGARSPETGGRP